jgi:hypothetical protein
MGYSTKKEISVTKLQRKISTNDSPEERRRKEGGKKEERRRKEENFSMRN